MISVLFTFYTNWYKPLPMCLSNKASVIFPWNVFTLLHCWPAFCAEMFSHAPFFVTQSISISAWNLLLNFNVLQSANVLLIINSSFCGSLISFHSVPQRSVSLRFCNFTVNQRRMLVTQTSWHKHHRSVWNGITGMEGNTFLKPGKYVNLFYLFWSWCKACDALVLSGIWPRDSVIQSGDEYQRHRRWQNLTHTW